MNFTAVTEVELYCISRHVSISASFSKDSENKSNNYNNTKLKNNKPTVAKPKRTNEFMRCSNGVISQEN